MRTPYRIATLLVIALPVVAWAVRHRAPADPRLLPDSEVDRSRTYSNILPEDYLGPSSCVQCHPRNYRLWSEHPHRRMNQLPGKNTIQGDFADHVLRLPTGEVHFNKEGDTYFVTARKDGHMLRHWRVTRTVGSRYMQYVIGVQVEGPEPLGSPVWKEHMVPFGWWASLGRWLPKHYFDPDGPEKLVDGVPQAQGIDEYTDVRPWTNICLSCHNTAPYAYRAAHKLYAGFPDATVSLAVQPLAEALAPTVSVAPSLNAFEAINANLEPDKHLVTLGISCESCHFGGREHVLAGAKMTFVPTSPYLKLTHQRADRPVTDDRKNAATITGLCTQCHSGNALLFPNGGTQCNSREALDFLSGSCTSQMTCTHCHEPHTAGAPEGAATSPAHVAACKKCHGQYADDKAALAHARHPASAGVTCLDCHMPRQVLGLDALVRTHRVGMPVEESMVAKGMANACNLCHLDRSPRWVLSELERGWKHRIEPQPSWDSWADLDRPAGLTWLHGEHTGMRLVASQSYARSPLGKDSLTDLIGALNDPEPINRVFHGKAVETVRGKRLLPQEYELTAPPALRARQIEAMLAGCSRR